ncbi:hypothetical protein B0T10DRAFT_481269 [Thelonectria olida]|uniref:Uncharacterized protein n=1 Tax=Thelonectria olida TaxID=1576542 RepID=A0A9P8W924_9HYPO|nr:hypothetical protein B0T10DRAFT_481269 [Thelonectria olida]
MASPSEIKIHHQTAYPAISPKRPELSTKGKRAFVTGGGSGIGSAIATSFAQSGITHLGLLGRNEKSLLKTKAEIEKINPATTVWTYAVDLVGASATQSAIAEFAASTEGKIDILVANAGYMPELSSVTDADLEDWWKSFEISVKGNFNLLRAFRPHAAEQATVLHISTAAIHLPYMQGYSGYRSSKIAAWKLFDYFHHENPDLVLIHVHPGLIGGTAMGDKVSISVKELGLVYDDISLPGDFAVWAASEEAKFLNGRLVWATWDVSELQGMKAAIAEDETKLTVGLFV